MKTLSILFERFFFQIKYLRPLAMIFLFSFSAISAQPLFNENINVNKINSAPTKKTEDPFQKLYRLDYPKEQKFFPIFTQPGFTNWRICLLASEYCSAWPPRKTQVQILTQRIIKDLNSRNNQETYFLFYKIKYSYTVNNVLSEGDGWIPSSYIKYKPLDFKIKSRIPASMTNLDFYGSPSKYYTKSKKEPESDILLPKEHTEEMVPISEVRRMIAAEKKQTEHVIFRNTLNSMTVFSFNKKLSHSFTRWNSRHLKAPPKESFLGDYLNLDLEKVFFLDYQGLSAQSQGKHYNDTKNLRMGFNLVVNLYLDLEVSSKFTYNHNLSNDPHAFNAVQMDEFLYFSTPWEVDGSPLKLAAGGHLIFFTKSPNDFNFKALLGIRGGVVIEGKRFISELTIGPVMDSQGPHIKSFESTGAFGYRLAPEKGFDSWILRAEVNQIQRYIADSNSRAYVQSINLGLQKSF